MKKSLIVLLVAASTSVAAFVGVAQAQKAKEVRYVSSEKASYKERAGGGPSMHVLRGDPDKGPHATFTKFTPASMLACTPTPTTFPAWSSKAPIYTRTTLAKSVSGQANISSSLAATNTGAAATKPKALSFIRKAPASSTLYRQSSKDRQHSRKSGDEFRRGPTNSVLVCLPPARRGGQAGRRGLQ